MRKFKRDFTQSRLSERVGSAIMSPVKRHRQGLVRIGFVSDLEQKAVRDSYSGLLRFLAATDAPWEVKAISPNAATDVELLRFRDWSPAGLVAVPEFMRMLTYRLAGQRLRRHVTVYLNRENISSRPANALDVCIDNNSLAGAAASLLMKRGLPARVAVSRRAWHRGCGGVAACPARKRLPAVA